MQAAPSLALAILAVALVAVPCRAEDADAGKGKAAPCIACHGANGNSTNPVFPSLAGQTARYLFLELRDFKEGRRENPAMLPFVKDLAPADMQDLGAYFAAQRLADNGFKPDAARVARGKAKAAETLCTMCHLGGFAGQNEVPRVAAQNHDYIVKQLTDFKERRRTNDAGTMTSVSKTLKDQDIETSRTTSRHWTELPLRAGGGAGVERVIRPDTRRRPCPARRPRRAARRSGRRGSCPDRCPCPHRWPARQAAANRRACPCRPRTADRP